jgi:predicted Rossmann fold nucleotide-binding protein DprA/Smf involved in DNA uptake
MPKPNIAPSLAFRGSASYPRALARRLGDSAPEVITIFGPSTPLSGHLVALFCSQKTPGAAILKALDQAAAWREEGRCVISGFHSPLERECLVTLLRGRQPVVMAMARVMDELRLGKAERQAYDDGRLTVLAPMTGGKRTTMKSSQERNRLVAALASEAVLAYIRPGGSLAGLTEEIDSWGGCWRQLI